MSPIRISLQLIFSRGRNVSLFCCFSFPIGGFLRAKLIKPQPLGQFSLPPIFINKTLLEYSCVHSLPITHGCFCTIRAQLNSCNREHMAPRTVLAFYGKKLSTTYLDEHYFEDNMTHDFIYKNLIYYAKIKI